MMEHYDWNEGWQFTPQYTPALCEAEYMGAPLAAVRIPHTVAPLPYNYCSEQAYQMVSGYRREFTASESWRGRHVLLTFGAVAHDATVYCNGIEVAHHACGYTAFTAELSGALRLGQKNVVTVRCDSRETLDVPPFGKVIDYLTYGGIYRAVTLDVKESTYLKDAFLTAGSDGTFRIYPTLEGEGLGCRLCAELFGPDGAPAGCFRGSASLPLSGSLNLVRQWTPDTPALYTLKLSLVRAGSEESGLPARVIDEKAIRFGFRTLDFRADGLYLNGNKVKLRGLDRHQCWAYQGYAMPDRQQRNDAVLLKKLGCNAVRTSHYPQSHAFLDACDELGLLVFTEMPGWQHIGGDAWKAQALANCREMVLQYRNHTSIFLWGVRINESADDDELYRKTNEAAHRLDPTRPTGGVRNFKHSHFFEDVYTYNDFVHCGGNPGCEPKRAVTSDGRKGYLVTEYCGHMFPVKAFDWEGRRTELALRHARILNDVAAEKDIAGSFGWCLFDYNTHPEFGSGDRICYHGVTDLFRNPKLAAAVYASQADIHRPGEDAVLEISSTMDLGEYPASFLPDAVAFTNADSVRLYKNGEFIAEFTPARKGIYSALRHPPILIDDVVGTLLETYEGFDHAAALSAAACLNAIRRGGTELSPLVKAQLAKLMLQLHMSYEQGMQLYAKYVGNWGQGSVQYRFDAVWHGEVVKKVTREPVRAVRLEVLLDDPALVDGPTWDCAAVHLRAVDQSGNVLPYFAEPVTLSLSGPAALLGPTLVPLRGGLAGTYVATTGEPGDAVLTARVAGCAPVSAQIHIDKA